MEDWNSLIQSLNTLEKDKQTFIINHFCDCAINCFQVSIPSLKQMLTQGNTHTLVALKLLTKLNSVPSLSELLDLLPLLNSGTEIFSLALQTYRAEFFSTVLCKTYEFPLKFQEEILEFLANLVNINEFEMNLLMEAILNVSKHSENSTEVSISLHHRAANTLLKSNPHLAAGFFSHTYFVSLSILSKELIHYIEIIPNELLNEQRLENELLDKDPSIRRNSMNLLKKTEKNKDFWELFECLENYNKTIISGIWPRIRTLFTCDMDKVCLLYKRAQTHENLSVRRFIAKHYMKQEKPDFSFILNTFILYLSDSGLYSNSSEIRSSKFGKLLTSFFIKFIKSSQNSNVTRQIMKNVFEFVQFHIAFGYFVDAFLEVFQDGVIDGEVLEKAKVAVGKQLTQMTPFQRSKSQKLMKMLVEVDFKEFLKEKIKLAVSLPGVCFVRFTKEEAMEVCKTSLDGVNEIWNIQELGYLFGLVFSDDLLEICGFVFRRLENVNDNWCLNGEDMKNSVWRVFFIVKYLNLFGRELNFFCFVKVLDGIFLLGSLVSDFEMVNRIGKLIKQIVLNGKQSYVQWALGKVSFLTETLKKIDTNLYPVLLLINNITKAVLCYKTHEFSSIFANLLEALQKITEKFVIRENLHQIIKIKWKILSKISEFSTVDLFEVAAGQLDSISLQMLNSVFRILFITLHPVADLEKILEAAWALVQETTNDAPLDVIFSFARFAFNTQVLFLESTNELLKKIINKGRDRWGLVRVVLLQLAPLWTSEPESIFLYTDCILDLCCYEETRAEDADFLVPCVFSVINIAKPQIKGKSGTLRNQYIRILVLKIVESSQKPLFLMKLFKKTIEALQDICKNPGEFPNSSVYKKKIRLSQLLCTLAPWCSAHCDVNILSQGVNSLFELLRNAYVHSSRQYIERFLVSILIKYPNLSKAIRIDYNMKPQLAGSCVLILGAVMVFCNSGEERSRIFYLLLPFMTSNKSYIRRLAHFVLFMMIQFYPEYQSYSPVLDYLLSNKDCQKILKRLENSLPFSSFLTCDLNFILTGYFSEFDEIIHDSLISQIEIHCKYLLDTEYEINYQDHWKQISKKIIENSSISHNFQRKVEDTPALTQLHTSKSVKNRHKLIIVASLIDNIPNLAGLTRTSEVFNLQMITVGVKNLRNQNEFKSQAVTADKWLPMIEIEKSELEGFLRGFRLKEYQVIGLEHTNKSVSLEKFRFCEKSVLVLGNEKNVIPSELIGILDFCLDVPSFGMIRPASVHINSSICIWEYIKQIYL